MGQLTQEQWDGLVSVNGEDWARDYVSRSGDTPPGEEPEDASDTPMTDPPANVAAEDDETPLSSSLSVGQLERDILQQQQAEAAMRKQRFDEAAKLLAEQRSGPPLSERLMMLTAAFAAPKSAPGFVGTMRNIMPVLAKESEAVRAGKATDAERLRLLKEKYEDADAAGMGKSLDRRVQLAKLQDQQNKANQPTFTYDAMGRLRTVPKSGMIHRPKNEAEFNAIPEGDYFIGPGMTDPIPKVTGGAS